MYIKFIKRLPSSIDEEQPSSIIEEISGRLQQNIFLTRFKTTQISPDSLEPEIATATIDGRIIGEREDIFL